MDKDLELRKVFTSILTNDRFKEISIANQEKIKKILEKQPENNAKASSKAKQYYQSCLKSDAFPTEEFMMSLIKKFGGWRMTSNCNLSMTFTERVRKIFFSHIQQVFE